MARSMPTASKPAGAVAIGNWLSSAGYILRFWNDDVIRDIDDVCQHIVTEAGLVAEDAARQAQFAQQEAHP